MRQVSGKNLCDSRRNILRNRVVLHENRRDTNTLHPGTNDVALTGILVRDMPIVIETPLYRIKKFI